MGGHKKTAGIDPRRSFLKAPEAGLEPATRSLSEPGAPN